MSVSNGDNADQATLNAAYLSRTADSDTVAVVGLKNPGSGGDVNNAQQAINDNASNIATNTSDIATNTANIGTNTTNIATNTGDIATNTAAIAAISVPADTDGLPEGTTNLYYTEARVNANANVTANTAKVSADGSIDTHSDVDTSTVAPTDTQVLTWVNANSKWEPKDAPDGIIDNLVESKNGTLANWTITASTWGDLTSISLDAGTWDITVSVLLFNNGATTYTNANIGVSTTSGNSVAGLNRSENNNAIFGVGTTTRSNNISIPRYTVSPGSTTTYYLKANVETSITNVQYTYYISARQVA